MAHFIPPLKPDLKTGASFPPKLEKQALHSMVSRLGPCPQACARKESLDIFTEENVGKMHDCFSNATLLSNKKLFSKLTMYHVPAMVVRTNQEIVHIPNPDIKA
jgi:hypothetical protein